MSIKLEEKNQGKGPNQMFQFRCKLLRFQQLSLLIGKPCVLISGRTLNKHNHRHILQLSMSAKEFIQ